MQGAHRLGDPSDLIGGLEVLDGRHVPVNELEDHHVHALDIVHNIRGDTRPGRHLGVVPLIGPVDFKQVRRLPRYTKDVSLVVRSDQEDVIGEPAGQDRHVHLSAGEHGDPLNSLRDRLVHRHEAHRVQGRRIGQAAATHRPLSACG